MIQGTVLVRNKCLFLIITEGNSAKLLNEGTILMISILMICVCTYVCMYVCTWLRNVAVTSRWNVTVSRLWAYKNSECHTCASAPHAGAGRWSEKIWGGAGKQS